MLNKSPGIQTENIVKFNKKLSEHEKEIRNLKNNAKKCKQEAEQYKLKLKNKPKNKVVLEADLNIPSKCSKGQRGV